MTQLLQVNLLLDAGDKKIVGEKRTPRGVGNVLFKNFLETLGEKRTPRGVGNGLFKGFLEKEGSLAPEGDWGLSLYEGTGLSRRTHEDHSGKSLNPLQELGKKFGHLGFPIGRLRLPRTAIPQLVAFLENQGLGREKIDQLIQSVTGKEGFIHLDKLMARLQGDGLIGGIPENSLVVQGRHIPEVQEMLFKMGLGAGEVKELIEKSVNRDGELVLGRLSGALGKFLPGPDAEKRLISLMERFDIKSGPRTIDERVVDPELKKILQDFSESRSQDIRKKIKQTLAGLLREKGIPPQEVKSFLESLSLESAKSLSKKGNPSLMGLSKADFERETAYLFNRVVIRSQPEFQKGGWQEKIIEILKNEQLLTTKDFNKNWFQEASPVRLNVAELLKQGEQNPKTAFLRSVLAGQNNQPSQVEGNPQKNHHHEGGNRHDFKGSPQVKEEWGGIFTGLKIGKETMELGSVNQVRHGNNLPHPLPKILNRMIWMIRAGEQRSRVHISPPELGRLDLELVIKQGHIQANLSAESLPVKELIEAHLGQLKQQLNDLGFVVDKFEVMVGLDNRRFQEEESRRAGGRKERSTRKSNTKKGDLTMETGPDRPPTHNLYQIDLHV